MYEDRQPSDIRTLIGHVIEIRNEGFPNACFLRIPTSYAEWLNWELAVVVGRHWQQKRESQSVICRLQEQLSEELTPLERDALKRDLIACQSMMNRCEIFLAAVERAKIQALFSRDSSTRPGSYH
jgi:hypothetical protein